MPANCSADVAAVIAYVDEVFTGSNTTAIDSIKETFGMSDLTHLDDAAGCTYVSVRYTRAHILIRS